MLRKGVILWRPAPRRSPCRSVRSETGSPAYQSLSRADWRLEIKVEGVLMLSPLSLHKRRPQEKFGFSHNQQFHLSSSRNWKIYIFRNVASSDTCSVCLCVSGNQVRWWNNSHLPLISSAADWLHPSAFPGSHSNNQEPTSEEWNNNQPQSDTQGNISTEKYIYMPIIRFGKGFSGSCFLLRFFSLRWFEQEPKKSRTFDVLFPQCTSETGVNYQVDYYQSPICDTWTSPSSSEEISPSPSDSEGGKWNVFVFVCDRKEGTKEKKKKNHFHWDCMRNLRSHVKEAGRNTRSESETTRKRSSLFAVWSLRFISCCPTN